MPNLIHSPKLSFYSPTFEQTWLLAEKAVQELQCAVSASKLTEEGKDSSEGALKLLPVSILLFTVRDHLAFQQIYGSSIYDRLIAKKPLRQLPTLNQLQALLKSLPGDWHAEEQARISSLKTLSDEALKVENLKHFREHWVTNGVLVCYSPNLENDSDPFPQQKINAQQLVQEALHGWLSLKEVIQAFPFQTVVFQK